MNSKMPISVLQELMAARRLPLPVYLEEQGSGAPFKCTVLADKITATGFGTTKKAAKHQSAANALLKLKSQQDIPDIISRTCPPEKPLKNYVGELNEFASKNGLQYPEYQFINAILSGEFVISCSFVGKQVQGRGFNKKDAKQDAARNMQKEVEADSAGGFERYKVVQETTTIFPENNQEAIEMFNALSINRVTSRPVKMTGIQPKADIEMKDEDTVEELEMKLKQHGIRYQVHQFQAKPLIMCVEVKDSVMTFLGVDDDRTEALKKALSQLLAAVKIGIDFSFE